MPEFDPGADLPPWAVAYAGRVWFHVRQRRMRRARSRALAPLLAGLRQHAAQDQALHALLHAAIDLAESAARAEPDCAAIRAEQATLAALARVAMADGCDDRPLLAREQHWPAPLSSRALCALRVPARVVFLGAMAAQLPAMQADAAAMLANDLAGLHRDLPMQALRLALSGPTHT